jgi:ubiquinone/menaquinone biosynthesis C-methylase UbiE
MSFYSERILPTLIDLAMRNKELRPYRERVIGAAEGRVLEIGIGSGRNLLLYPANVELVIGLDPSQLLAMARKAAREGRRDIELLEGSAAAIPLENSSMDTAISTWSLCSIADAPRALSEMHRVLKPGGRFLFVAGRGRPLVAGPFNAALEPHWGWLPSQPCDRRDDWSGWLSNGAARERPHTRA